MSLWPVSNEERGKVACRVASVVLAAIVLIPIPASTRHASENGSPPADVTTRQGILDNFHSLGGYFIENRGQVSDLVRHYSTGNPAVAFRDDGVMVVMREEGAGAAERQADALGSPPKESDSSRSLAYLVHFDGANKVTPAGRNRLQFNSNFFIGNDSGKWRTGVPNYGEVVYHDLYDGIDLAYRQNANGVKYEFIISPGADPGAIRMSYEAIDSLRLEGAEIVAHTVLGEVRDLLPFSYQKGGGRVECRFSPYDAVSYGFECEGRDHSKTLVIDPLVYSTFLGGSWQDYGGPVAVDSSGKAIVAIQTQSTNFPVTPGVYDTGQNGLSDVAVVKLNESGSGLVFSTFLGGNDDDWPQALEIDSVGNAYIAGTTASVNFPVTPGAFKTINKGGRDVFVTKLDPTGSALIYSTYLGGTDMEDGYSMAVDQAGNAYLHGWTLSSDFPVTVGAFDAIHDGSWDTFVTKLNQSGSGLVFSTFLGGSQSDNAGGIAVCSSGDVILGGATLSPDFPITPGAYDTSYNGDYDVYVTRLNKTGHDLIYSTFIGGNSTDHGLSLAIDPSENVYITGHTHSLDFPTTPGAFREIYNGGTGDAYVLKLNAVGNALLFSTYVGGNAEENAYSIALDSDGNATITGETSSADFSVTPDAIQATFRGGVADVFVTELNAAGSIPTFSTYLGGSGWERGVGVAIDFQGATYISGPTSSEDFRTTTFAFDTTFNSAPFQHDAFAAKLGLLPNTMPDYVPFEALPSSPTQADLSQPLPLSTKVRNHGNATAFGNATLAFFNESSPSTPFATFTILPLIELQTSPRSNATWVSPAIPGTYRVSASVDYYNNIAEWNETNNVYTWMIVVGAPHTSLTVGQPNYTANFVFITSLTPLTLQASSPIGANIAYTEYMVDELGWTRYASPFTLTGDGLHLVEYRSADDLGNLEVARQTILVVDDTPPASWFTIGAPVFLSSGKTWITSATNLSLAAQEHAESATFVSTPQGLVVYNEPVEPNESFVDYLARANLTVTREIWPGVSSVTFHVSCFPGPDIDLGVFYDMNRDEVRQVSELAGYSAGATQDETVILRSPQPGSYIIIVAGYDVSSPVGCPVDMEITQDFGGSDTTGLSKIEYRVWSLDVWSDWMNYVDSFQIAGESQALVEYRAYDRIGNTATHNMTVFVDNTPPTTTISPAVGDFTNKTLFTLSTSDSGCGVSFTEYRIDGGGWRRFPANFTLENGNHTIYYRSVDNLGNVEMERNLTLTIRIPSVSPQVESNYKPLVAVIFAIVLLVAGLWSSKRRPWKGGKDRKAVLKAFAITSLPLVLAEGVTGLTSFLTGELRIPPCIGIGTAVDMTILLVGLGVAVMRVLKATPLSAEIAKGAVSR